jgi:hypothetical protein
MTGALEVHTARRLAKVIAPGVKVQLSVEVVIII